MKRVRSADGAPSYQEASGRTGVFLSEPAPSGDLRAGVGPHLLRV